MHCISRRESMRFGVSTISALGISSVGSASVGMAQGTKLYEHTLLKSKPGQHANLGRFIISNWFPMDQLGLEKGIFTSYWLLEESNNNDDWDYVMVVGYPTELGYSDPLTIELFKAIRRQHIELKIDDKGLRELGDIVGNHRLKIISG